MATALRATDAMDSTEDVAGVESVERGAAQKCFENLRQVFDNAWSHPSVKVVQTAVSSAQNLLQSPVCSELCRVIVPGLVDAIATEPPKLPIAAMEHAWGLFPTLLAAQSQTGDAKLAKSSIHLLLQLVSHLSISTMFCNVLYLIFLLLLFLWLLAASAALFAL